MNAHANLHKQNAEQYRESASDHERKLRESWDRSDTDGFLSQWSHQVCSQQDHLAAEIEDNRGLWEFPALFDLSGNLVPARYVETRYGMAWMLLGESDECAGWFNPSNAKHELTRRRNNARKGYYVGRVLAPAKAVLRGANVTSVRAVAVRKDSGYSEDVTVLDNGIGN